MEEFRFEPSFPEEIDLDYEFDAPTFYDFSRSETESEAEEAELWFETTGDYPPSPMLLKLNWRQTSVASLDENHEIDSTDEEAEAATKGKAKKVSVKPAFSRCLSFMNPTASQLAKQNHLPEIHWEQLLRRPQKLIPSSEKSSTRRSSVFGAQPTKRQKLDSGYLTKVSRLKHRAHFLHKAPKKVGVDANTTVPRPKVTVPKEPNLATAYRAERRRFKTKVESAANPNSEASNFRTRPLNRKILKAPSLPLPRKRSPQMPEFHVFHLRTSERAWQHASLKSKFPSSQGASIPNGSCILQNETTNRRVSCDSILTEKLEDKVSSQCLDRKIFPSRREINVLNSTESKLQTEHKLTTDRTNELPVESFSKLSLTSESPKSEGKTLIHSKVLKENAPGSFNQENERLGGNNYQCGSGQRINSIAQQINVKRSLDIR